MFRSSNPALNLNVFQNSRSYGVSGSMTLQGVVNKTFLLLAILFISAAFVWNKAIQPAALFYDDAAASAAVDVGKYIMIGLIGSIISYIVILFNMRLVKFMAPVYALFEGLALGGLSAYFEMSYPGIASQAITFTVGTLLCMLVVYKTGLVRVTDKFRTGLIAAMGAICLIYLVSIVLSLFKISMPLIHSSSPFGIGFSVVVVAIAAFTLLLDFDNIHQGVSMGASKEMEWYSAFGLMVSLIWLYLEILKLLAKLQNRR